jgi:predicted Fe-Mo cluster-binding NifX family protein
MFMKIAFPSQEDRGMDSTVYGHFGSANYFVIVETDDGSFDTIQNPERVHLHGQCQPLNALGGRPVDAVVAGGIGGGALRKLLAAGLKAYRAVDGSVKDNLELIQSAKLPEFNMNHTCGGHGGQGGCAH